MENSKRGNSPTDKDHVKEFWIPTKKNSEYLLISSPRGRLLIVTGGRGQDVPLSSSRRPVVLVKMSRCVGRYISSSSPRCPFDVADTSRCLRLRVPAPPPDSIIIYYLSFIISHPKRPVISSQCPFSTSVDLNQGRNDEKVGRIFTFSCFFLCQFTISSYFCPVLPSKRGRCTTFYLL